MLRNAHTQGLQVVFNIGRNQQIKLQSLAEGGEDRIKTPLTHWVNVHSGGIYHQLFTIREETRASQNISDGLGFFNELNDGSTAHKYVIVVYFWHDCIMTSLPCPVLMRMIKDI